MGKNWNKFLVIFTLLLIVGCATQAGKDFYTSCLDSGAEETICKQGANEINKAKTKANTSRFIGALGKGLKNAGEAMQSHKKREPPRMTTCTTRKMGNIERQTCREW